MAKKEAKANKENNKNKKSFFKSFKAELKKVTWPTPKQLVNNTVAVITIVLITAVIVLVLDIAFETINKQGVDRIKGAIGTLETVDENNETQEDSATEENATTEGQTENGQESTGQENSAEQNAQENTENSAE